MDLTALVGHIDQCNHPNCKKICFKDKRAFVGTEEEVQTDCSIAHKYEAHVWFSINQNYILWNIVNFI